MVTDTDFEHAININYQNQFSVVAGYLSKHLEQVDEWISSTLDRALTEQSVSSEFSWQPAVAHLAEVIESDGIVRMYVSEMIDQVPEKYKTIECIDELLLALNFISQRAPEYNSEPAKRNFFPISALFVRMMYTPAGEAAFRNTAFNDAIRVILQSWCDFLDSAASQNVLNTDRYGWLSPSAYAYSKLDEFIIPDKQASHWGFKSFNDYFHRQIKPEYRPIFEPNNPKAIVSANDGTVYRIANNVQRKDRFWLKAQPYSLVNMLNNSEYVDRFIGGDVFQSFLSGADFHRWHAPIDGVVCNTQIVNALMFSELHSQGYDPSAGTYSQGYEASVNTRGLVFIESDDEDIGLVCVMPIGITEISSVTIEVKVGQQVRKGDELGYFSYGGSSMCLLFQAGAIDRFTTPLPPEGGNPDAGPKIQVNDLIAIAS